MQWRSYRGNGEAGFTLPEVLLSFSLLLIALVGSIRLVWMSVSQTEQVERAALFQAALGVVMAHWEDDPSEVATARLTETGWEVHLFPDESWLPSGSERDMGSGQSLMFRRRRELSKGGFDVWRVEGLMGKWRPLLWVHAHGDSAEAAR